MSDHLVAQIMKIVGTAVVGCSGLLLAAAMFVAAVEHVRVPVEALASWRRFILAERKSRESP